MQAVWSWSELCNGETKQSNTNFGLQLLQSDTSLVHCCSLAGGLGTRESHTPKIVETGTEIQPSGTTATDEPRRELAEISPLRQSCFENTYCVLHWTNLKTYGE